MIPVNCTNIIQSRIPGMHLGLLYVSQVTVIKNDASLDKGFLDLKLLLKEEFADTRPAQNAIVSYVRRMYRRIGWEPTRYRPSSEALVRRVLKDQELYRINNLVDWGNITSARFHLPMGLYDADKIDGKIEVDVGRPGESYTGISKDKIHAEGKLILRDQTGIFGNPTADSRRTSISGACQNALAVFFCPPEVEKAYLRQTLIFLADAYGPYAGQSPIQEIVTFTQE